MLFGSYLVVFYYLELAASYRTGGRGRSGSWWASFFLRFTSPRWAIPYFLTKQSSLFIGDVSGTPVACFLMSTNSVVTSACPLTTTRFKLS